VAHTLLWRVGRALGRATALVSESLRPPRVVANKNATALLDTEWREGHSCPGLPVDHDCFASMHSGRYSSLRSPRLTAGSEVACAQPLPSVIVSLPTTACLLVRLEASHVAPCKEEGGCTKVIAADGVVSSSSS
jgi:hypothetical protein